MSRSSVSLIIPSFFILLGFLLLLFQQPQIAEAAPIVPTSITQTQTNSNISESETANKPLPEHPIVNTAPSSLTSNHKATPLVSQNSTLVSAQSPTQSLSVSSSTNASTSTLSQPFSVQIRQKQYYGGLITYSHALHPARFCRLLNGCIRPDGTLLLPAWMQRHDDVLTFHCGHPRVEFTLDDTHPPSKSLEPLDLIGIPPAPHPSMSSFISDFMPSAVVFDLLYGAHDRVSRACHSRLGGDSCDGFPTLDSDSLRASATVLLPQRLESVDEKQSWPKQFVNLMKPPGIGRKPKIMYDYVLERDAKKSETGSVCFRSVFFTRGPFNKNSIMDDHLRNIHFLSLHGIEKAPRTIWVENENGKQENNAFAAFENQMNRRCQLNVTISNRKPYTPEELKSMRKTREKNRRRELLLPRYIPNVNALRTEILKQASKIPGLDLTVNALTLEGRALRWQMNAMQKTDIFVSGHGPLLTNMIFLRENSTVFELQPFAYYPNTYDLLAQRVAHVGYDRYIAHPDYPAFHACVSQLYPRRHPHRSRALGMLRKFALATDKYRQSDSTHTIVLHTIEEGDDMYNIARCARMQRLDTNAKQFAIAIVRNARLTCGLPLPMTSAQI